ncbi:MAG: hypothetical protein ABWY25_08940 [Paenisporosarcina sp.]
MATVTGYTAERMKEIEDTSVVNGNVVGNDLILVSRDGKQLNAGNVRGPQGIVGPTGPTSIVPCLSTARPVGGSLFTGLAIYETDTKRFYIYNGSSWVYSGGLWVCTSTTRPANPFQGMEIYETDTKKFLIYNGVRFDPPWNQPWGLMGMIQRTTDAGPVSGAEVSIAGMLVTLTVVANRRLKITFEGNCFAPSGSDNITFLRIAEDAISLATGNAWNTAPGYATSLHCEAFRTPAAGSHQFYIRVGSIGSGSVMVMGRPESPMSLVVEDMGPNGLPA